MSFITKIGEDTGSSQKLVLMRKKYFRNILEFNQQSQQEKKEEEVKKRVESHRQFNQIVHKELEVLDREKEQVWSRKVNNQSILKGDYEKQMVQRVEGFRQ